MVAGLAGVGLGDGIGQFVSSRRSDGFWIGFSTGMSSSGTGGGGSSTVGGKRRNSEEFLVIVEPSGFFAVTMEPLV